MLTEKGLLPINKMEIVVINDRVDVERSFADSSPRSGSCEAPLTVYKCLVENEIHYEVLEAHLVC